MSLTDTAVRAAKPDAKARKVSDGQGLYLFIPPQGSKLWRLAYRFGGKQKTLALGAYPAVSLAEAREGRDAAKKLLAQGIDPGEQKKVDRIAAATAAADTFGVIALEWIEKQVREGRSEKTMARNHRLAKAANRDLGKRPISQISAREVLDTLRKFEAQGKHETASRLKVLISAVFKYAIATARAENDPTIALTGALTAPEATPRAAILDPAAFGGLLRALDGYAGQPEVIAALRLMPILYPRQSELRQAEWSEFDLDAALWIIPAARMKMRREHRKPLPPQAVTILRELRRLTGGGALVFPGIGNRLRPISENTINSALRRLGFAQNEVSSHGFRATASTLLNESGLWTPDAVERELSHLDGNQQRAPYARGSYWPERVEMQAWWADLCDHLRAGGKFAEKVEAEKVRRDKAARAAARANGKGKR